MSKLVVCVLTLLLYLFSSSACATSREERKMLVDALSAKGVSTPEVLRQVFGSPRFQINAVSSELSIEYLSRHALQRLERSRLFLTDNKGLLLRAKSVYGADKVVIAALVGIESNYGIYLGRYGVLGRLAALFLRSQDDDAKQYYLEQLGCFLQLANQERWNVWNVRGSSEGAMGLAQIQPCTFMKYKVDGNGDGLSDPLQMADAVMTLAHKLHVEGENRAIARYNPRDTTYAPRIHRIAMALRKEVRLARE